MSSPAGPSHAPYNAIASGDDEAAPLLTHEHSTKWNTDRQTMTALSAIGTALDAIFVIATGWVLSRSFHHCNRYLNGLFMVFLIMSVASFGMGLLRMITRSIPARSGHLPASMFLGMKMLFLIFFVLVAYQPEEACDSTIDKAARGISVAAAFANLGNMAIMEYGFSVTTD